ncbi:TrbM/KikA/MpfK family conjugal transfer protein [Castellaniella sp. UC4442_H9]
MHSSFLRRTCVAALIAAVSSTACAQSAPGTDLLTGDTRLACEAILCLSSGLQPGECAPALERYFGIQIFNHHGLDWGATVDARRAFLQMCPSASADGMADRINAISQGAGKCDPEYLNQAYARTSYRWRLLGYSGGGDDGGPVYEVHPIQTVSPNTLPSYCVTYTEHAWTYELAVKYVGDPLHGGKWVKAEDYSAAYGAWLASHGGAFTNGWQFTWNDPRDAFGSMSMPGGH